MSEIETMSFEEAIERLEELVKKLEEGNLNLDESLKIYEQAVALRERCRTILDDSERRVQKLIMTANGMIKDDLDS